MVEVPRWRTLRLAEGSGWVLFMFFDFDFDLDYRCLVGDDYQGADGTIGTSYLC